MESFKNSSSYTRSQAREAALSALYQAELAKINQNKALENILSMESYPSSISIFIQELVLKTCEHREELDDLIKEYIKQNSWEFSRLAVLDRNILRLAFYEIKYIEKIPPKVSISEYVNIANKFCTPEQGRFIHGVLGKHLKVLDVSI